MPYSSAPFLASCAAAQLLRSSLYNLIEADLVNMASDKAIVRLPLALPGSLPEFYAAYEPFTDEAYFNCGAEELATKLLGRFLYGPHSEVMLRIVETEAYPHGDGVYDEIFGDVAESFPNKAGVVLRLSAALHSGPARSHPGEHVYITAGGAQGARDLVLIRSCVPHVQEKNYLRRIEGLLSFSEHTPTSERDSFLLRPDRVAAAVAKDRVCNPVLYEAGGHELCMNAAREHPVDYLLREATRYGRRVLGESKFHDPSVVGYWAKLRFAFYIEKFNLIEECGKLEFNIPIEPL